MKILHVITGLETGGAEASLYKLVRHSTEAGTEHVVCSLRGQGTFGPRFSALGIQLHALNGKPRDIVWSLRTLVGRLQPGVIHGWMYHGNLAASACRLGATRASILWNIRQTLSDLSNEKTATAIAIRLGALLSRHPRCIVYNSQTAARQHEAFGYMKDRARIIPNGFDTDLFTPDNGARAQIRAQIGVHNEVPLIGCIARHHPMKDHANFLRAAGKIKAIRPDAMFMLAGRNTDAPEISRIVHGLALNDNVRILGERSDISAIMAALDMLIMPSAWGEAFPNVVGEAMASGVPCVVTDVGDSGHIVGDTGIVVPPRDSDALARAMLCLLQQPDRKTIGLRARERIVAEYSLTAMTGSYRNLYAQILATPRAGRQADKPITEG